MRIFATLLAVGVLSLSGCGLLDTKPCEKADQAAQSITTKAQSCSGLSIPTIKGQADCETAVKNCNDAEKTIISDEMNCLINNVGSCQAGNESDWVKSVTTCIAATAALSSGCKQGFGL